MKAIVVRDAIHGYIRIATHERIVVDHPITQRLRYVSQTGLAHLVYPEARTARFVHSLGAMHLASRFLVSAVESAEPATARAFLDELEKEFKDIQEEAKTSLVSCANVEDCELLFENTGNLSGHGLLAATTRWRGSGASTSAKEHQLLGFAEAALRLAALFHDLGHLPMSHDFEYALGDYGSLVAQRPRELDALLSGPPPHENVGHKLAPIVLTQLVTNDPDLKADAKRAAVTRAVYRFAWKILDEEPEYEERRNAKASARAWLHSLIDGELDVDRADYLLRDGRALSFDFAVYDLERLVDNLVLVQHPEMGFATAVDERGLSALESFFLSRFRSNQLLVRHHKTSQVGQAFRYASTKALLAGVGDPLLKCLYAIVDGKAEAGALEELARYDDVWWLERLRDWNGGGNTDDKLLKASLDLVLRRQRAFTSLWKRQGDVPEDLRVRLNAAAQSLWKRTRWNSVRQQLHKDDVLLARYTFTALTKRPEPDGATGTRPESVTLIKAGQQLKAASKASAVIDSLWTWFDGECHVHAFVVSDGTRLSPAERVDRLARVAETFEQALLDGASTSVSTAGALDASSSGGTSG